MEMKYSGRIRSLPCREDKDEERRVFDNLIFGQTCWASEETLLTLSNIENKTNQIFCTSDRQKSSLDVGGTAGRITLRVILPSFVITNKISRILTGYFPVGIFYESLTPVCELHKEKVMF